MCTRVCRQKPKHDVRMTACQWMEWFRHYIVRTEDVCHVLLFNHLTAGRRWQNTQRKNLILLSIKKELWCFYRHWSYEWNMKTQKTEHDRRSKQSNFLANGYWTSMLCWHHLLGTLQNNFSLQTNRYRTWVTYSNENSPNVWGRFLRQLNKKKHDNN